MPTWTQMPTGGPGAAAVAARSTLVAFGVVASAVLLPASPAFAQTSGDASREACFSSFETSQDLREKQQLLATRDKLEQCGAAECPDVVRSKCIEWLEEVRQAIPTLVVSAVDATGQAQTDFAVYVDGVRVADTLGGLPLEVDPGTRQVRIERAGQPPLEKSVVANHGQKSQQVRFDLPAAPADPAAPVAAPVAPLVPPPAAPADESAADDSDGGVAATTVVGVISLSLGGAALVVGAITGALALSKGSDLEAACTDKVCPTDTQSDYDTGTAMADVSTITFIAGGVLAAAGVTLLLVGGGDRAPAESASVRAWLAPTGVGVAGAF